MQIEIQIINDQTREKIGKETPENLQIFDRFDLLILYRSKNEIFDFWISEFIVTIY